MYQYRSLIVDVVLWSSNMSRMISSLTLVITINANPPNSLLHSTYLILSFALFCFLSQSFLDLCNLCPFHLSLSLPDRHLYLWLKKHDLQNFHFSAQ